MNPQEQRIKPLPSPVDHDAADRLRELLADAESGNLTGLVVIAIRADGEVRHAVTGAAYATPHLTLSLIDRLVERVRAILIR